MRVLAFDCAGAQCAAAILADSEIVAAGRFEAERGHAQLLMPLLVDLLGQARLSFDHIDRFAVTIGPGSFTGIRVALAAAQGLAIGAGKPIVGITNFEVLAAAAAEAGISAPRILAVIESRRAECFVQLFDASGGELGGAEALHPEKVPEWAGPGRIALAGDAAWRVAPYFDNAQTIAVTADPAMIARLAASRDPGRPVVPFYLRAADAMPRRDV